MRKNSSTTQKATGVKEAGSEEVSELLVNGKEDVAKACKAGFEDISARWYTTETKNDVQENELSAAAVKTSYASRTRNIASFWKAAAAVTEIWLNCYSVFSVCRLVRQVLVAGLVTRRLSESKTSKVAAADELKLLDNEAQVSNRHPLTTNTN